MATKKWYFRTPIDEPKKITTPAGSQEEEVLAMKIDDYGNEVFYVKGTTNVYEKIQAFKSETDMETILRKVSDTGDITLLNRKEKAFMELEDMPDNIFEMHQKIRSAEDTFNNLPVETRKEFDFNFNKFLAEVGTEDWMKAMGYMKEEPKTEETIKEEKAEDE